MASASHLLAAIEGACERYEHGEADLAALQDDVEPVFSALDADVDRNVKKALEHFVAQLEYIRFMFEVAEQRAEVMREIGALRDCFERHRSASP